MKLIFLIIASNDPIHLRDEETQKNTWARIGLADAIWLRGDETTHFEETTRTLYVEIKDNYANILQKTLLGIDWCLDNLEFDFLIRANVSTYFDVEKTKAFLSKIEPNMEFFGGYLDFVKTSSNIGWDNLFVNGGALFFSKETTKTLKEMCGNKWLSSPDDFAISQFLIKRNIKPVQIPRGNVAQTGILTNRMYYRMKSSSNSNMATLRMRKLFQIKNSSSPIQIFILCCSFYYNEIRNFRRNFSGSSNYFRSLYSICSAAINSRKVVENYVVE
jgi:hypothetical protein